MSPLFGVFSRGLLVKETAGISGKVDQRFIYKKSRGAFYQQ